MVSLGLLDEPTLDALIANAAAILVLIDYSGGPNLKAAEALFSGRSIITTRAGLRGYEQYAELARVTIANTPLDFEAAIQRALAPGHRVTIETDIPRELLWEPTTTPVVELVRNGAPLTNEAAA